MKSEGGVGSPSRMGAESITLPWHWCGFRCVPKLGWDASVKLNEARHGSGWIFVMLFSFPSFIHFLKGGGSSIPCYCFQKAISNGTFQQRTLATLVVPRFVKEAFSFKHMLAFNGHPFKNPAVCADVSRFPSPPCTYVPPLWSGSAPASVLIFCQP